MSNTATKNQVKEELNPESLLAIQNLKTYYPVNVLHPKS